MRSGSYKLLKGKLPNAARGTCTQVHARTHTHTQYTWDTDYSTDTDWIYDCTYTQSSQVALVVKNPPAHAEDIKDIDLTPGSGRFLGGGNGNPLQYSCLENPMDRGPWWAIVYRVTKSQTGLNRLGTQACTHTYILTGTIQLYPLFWICPYLAMLGMSSTISVRSHQAHIFLSLFIININAILNNEK